jgi:hypothetical protein
VQLQLLGANNQPNFVGTSAFTQDFATDNTKSNIALLAKISNLSGANYTVTDVPVASALTVAGNSGVYSLSLAGGANPGAFPSMSYDVYMASASKIAKISNFAQATVTVTNVGADQAASLASSPLVDAITLSTNVLTAAQFTPALANLVTNNGLTITNVGIAQASSALGNCMWAQYRLSIRQARLPAA